jgi:SAM-dependent MidA family methyltransferase
MSCRWSQDNLVTSDPARLYDGQVLERIDLESLGYLIPDLEKRMGPVKPGAGRMGVFTWDIACASDAGPFILQVPLVLDARGRRNRAKSDLPRLNVENMRYFRAQGLTRFVMEPRDFMILGGNVPAAIFAALPDHHPLTFGQGAVQVEPSAGRLSWAVALGPRPTADLLAEMVAALVYHYEPDREGGTAVTDVCVNDGDFTARRRPDGSFDVRLTAVRQREGAIGPSLLLLYLIQMMAYEDWSVDGGLVGLPVLISNPSVTFEGVVRGLRYRCRDLGQPEEQGSREARQWIRDFGRSRVGRAYRPWAERFLAGGLPATFGGDTRERWWRLIPLQKKLGFLELRARLVAGQNDHGRPDSAAKAEESARALRTVLDRLSAEIGRAPPDEPGMARINDLGRDGLMGLLEEARVPPASRDAVADDILAHWPHRNLSQLLADVPGAHALRKVKTRISFGRVVAESEQATLASIGPASKEGGAARPLANAEVFNGWLVAPNLHASAVQTFPTFEAYMDAALHDEAWGYYAHGVLIGSAGHFTTSPESMSPHYGKWLAAWAFRTWKDMIGHGELTEADPFPVIEFGAGNGRLARDFLDAIAQVAAVPKASASTGQPDEQRWRTFASRVEYRIYETSASLRDKQHQLLGPAAVVAEGDARRPAETLKRDFPTGVKGFVLSNEVPDAFGVHKVVVTADGDALAALVVPRLEATLRQTLAQQAAPADGLTRRIAAADAAVRETFSLRQNPGDLYLDAGTFAAVMEALARFPAGQAEPLLSALWFEEAYVPVAAVPELAAHLRANAAQYATALAAEDSGVVLYVNVHADRFIRELASSLRAGVIVTIDYGDTTWGLVQGARRGDFPFRVYGDWQDYVPRPNDPYSVPGTQDMTADVNFTDLAHAGQDAGLRVLHYGPERDVIGADLAEVIVAGADQPAVAEFLGNPVFKVLVLGTRPSAVFTGPLLSPLPLSYREQDVPKSRRPKIVAIQATIENILAEPGAT